MKLGINLLLWTAHVNCDHFCLFHKVREAGFDGVEIPIFEGDSGHFHKVREALNAEGLAATAVTIVDEKTSPISSERPVRQAALDRLRWATEMAEIIGARILGGPFHSPLAVFTGQGPTVEEFRRATEVLRAAAEQAAHAGVTLAIEYLNRFECYFLTTARQAKELVQEVDHPGLRLMYDTFHAHIEEKSVGPVVGEIADVLVHVHISENDRGVPGTGLVRWEETFRALKGAGYDRWLVIEAFGRALPALAASTRIWRDTFRNAEEVITSGAEFVRRQWAAGSFLTRTSP
jgi:D-psicose/D-tagatose/L-ribulose 3-epimerase